MAKSKKIEVIDAEVVEQQEIIEPAQEEKVEEVQAEEVHPHKVGLSSRDYRSKHGK